MIPKTIMILPPYSLLSTCFRHQSISKIMEPIQPANTASIIQSIINVSSSLLFWRKSYHVSDEGALNVSLQGLKAYKGPKKQKGRPKKRAAQESEIYCRIIRYPTPMWVWIYLGADGSSSIFLRRVAIKTRREGKTAVTAVTV